MLVLLVLYAMLDLPPAGSFVRSRRHGSPRGPVRNNGMHASSEVNNGVGAVHVAHRHISVVTAIVTAIDIDVDARCVVVEVRVRVRVNLL